MTTTMTTFLTGPEKDTLTTLALKEVAGFKTGVLLGVEGKLSEDLMVYNSELRLSAATNTYRSSLTTKFLDRYGKNVQGGPNSADAAKLEKEKLTALLGATGYDAFTSYLDKDIAYLTNLCVGLEAHDVIEWARFKGNIETRCGQFRLIYKEIFIDVLMEALFPEEKPAATETAKTRTTAARTAPPPAPAAATQGAAVAS